MWRPSGLRMRVAANLAAAVSLCFGLLAFSTLTVMRSSVHRAERDAVTRVADIVSAHLARCAGQDACVSEEIHLLRGSGVTVERHTRPAESETRWVSASQEKPARVVTERPFSSGSISIELPLAPIAERAQRGTDALLVTLVVNAIALIVIGTLLFERAMVRRLAKLEEQLSSIERLDLDTSLLASDDGDAFGKMHGTLRRVTERLREDKVRAEQFIAELQHTNRTLRDTQESLTRSDRLATVGRLAAGVAHEIGNPIAAILGYLEIVRTLPTGASPEYLTRIEREAKRIDRIVRDLIDFARPQPLTVGPVDLRAAIDTAARLVQPQPRWRSMRLDRVDAADLCAVSGQEHYIVQVLLNLLINAADASQGRGCVTVTTATTQTGVLVTVSDEGAGIPVADLSRIFDPFFTTKPPGEGTGLGLAICHRIMESFGGSISVENRPEGGARFTLQFTRYDAFGTLGSRAA